MDKSEQKLLRSSEKAIEGLNDVLTICCDDPLERNLAPHIYNVARKYLTDAIAHIRSLNVTLHELERRNLELHGRLKDYDLRNCVNCDHSAVCGTVRARKSVKAEQLLALPALEGDAR